MPKIIVKSKRDGEETVTEYQVSEEQLKRINDFFDEMKVKKKQLRDKIDKKLTQKIEGRTFYGNEY